jgi:hypothetical protein
MVFHEHPEPVRAVDKTVDRMAYEPLSGRSQIDRISAFQGRTGGGSNPGGQGRGMGGGHGGFPEEGLPTRLPPSLL